MEDIKNPVTEVTENVEEQTTEEPVVVEEPKIYTEADFNRKLDEILPKKLARREAKIRKEYEDKLSVYKETESVLNAGLGTSNINEANNSLKEFYKSKGVEIPEYQRPVYSDDDLKVLANNEAKKIIELGLEEVIEEVDRLADKGVENMTPREKLVFGELANYRNAEQDKKELAAIGVGAEAINDKDFIEFAKDLNPKMSVKEKYEKYLKYRPKKEVETIGSMKNSTNEDTTVKEFYTRDEALKFTKKDFDKNPELFKAVENSMRKW